MTEHLAPSQLVEVVREDRRRRWQKGERILAETYLERYPALQADPPCVLELIYHEILLRQELGETPQLEEYRHRFPQLAPQLEPLFEVEAWFRDLEAGHGNDTPSMGTSQHLTPPGQGVVDHEGLPAVPGYEILRRLGRGGMGVVYQARDTRLNRVVALKTILGGAYAEPAELARFRAEAEGQARLQHPNIVQVYEVGEAGGCPYFALEFVEGGS